VAKRAEELAISHVLQGVGNKRKALEGLCRDWGVAPLGLAYVGDDVNDLWAMKLAGFACAPANAAPEIKAVAHFVAEKRGGEGAAREAVEYILRAQGKWEAGLEFFDR
jgi:3-deoxy-D-manno-octulosonate 8-phosphate phosphatase (KDO 8-P phosphatase)